MQSPHRRDVLLAAGATLGGVGLAGCSDLLGENGEFALTEVAFAAESPTGVGEFDPQPDATYAAGDPVWVYVEVANPPTDDDGTATLSYTYAVTAPDGEAWEPHEREETWEDAANVDVMVAQEFETFEDDPSGEYVLEVQVDAQATDEHREETVSFFLE